MQTDSTSPKPKPDPNYDSPTEIMKCLIFLLLGLGFVFIIRYISNTALHPIIEESLGQLLGCAIVVCAYFTIESIIRLIKKHKVRDKIVAVFGKRDIRNVLGILALAIFTPLVTSVTFKESMGFILIFGAIILVIALISGTIARHKNLRK